MYEGPAAAGGDDIPRHVLVDSVSSGQCVGVVASACLTI